MSVPPPEVTVRLAEPGEVPTGARRIAAAAERAGWRVVPTYARGTWIGYRVPRVVDSLALRMWWKDGLGRAVAVWLDGKYEQGWTWRPGEWPAPRNATQLREVLASWA